MTEKRPRNSHKVFGDGGWGEAWPIIGREESVGIGVVVKHRIFYRLAFF
jgi:hypothetical protein